MSDRQRPTAEQMADAYICITGKPAKHRKVFEQSAALHIESPRRIGQPMWDDTWDVVERLVIVEQENAALRGALAGNPQPIDVED